MLIHDAVSCPSGAGKIRKNHIEVYVVDLAERYGSQSEYDVLNKETVGSNT